MSAKEQQDLKPKLERMIIDTTSSPFTIKSRFLATSKEARARLQKLRSEEPGRTLNLYTLSEELSSG